MNSLLYPLIALLGADGVGKTRVAMALAERMVAKRLKTPTSMFDQLRIDSESLTYTARYMMYAFSVAHIVPEMQTSRKKHTVILDRYIQCTVAFHSSLGVPIDPKLIQALELPEPTLSVHLFADFDIRKERMQKRKTSTPRPDEVIENNRDVQEDVISCYRNLEQFGFDGGFLPVEINTNETTPDQIADQILEMLPK